MDTANIRRIKIRELSASSRDTLAACPRKFELAKLSNGRGEDTIHTVFGKAVGAGLQAYFGDESLVTPEMRAKLPDQTSVAILATLLAWTIPLHEREPKGNKSFGVAVFMVQKFIVDCESGELPFAGWKFIGAEVGFLMKLPDEFKYRGFMDICLLSPEGMPAFIEIKTTGMKFSKAADWQNAEQGNGYSLVLPAIVPAAAESSGRYLSYYAVGLTYTQKWLLHDFVKTNQNKMDFASDLLAEVQVLKFYESLPRFPMRGKSCNNFGRECEWLGLCHLDNDRLVNWAAVKPDDDSKYPNVIDILEDL